MEQNRRTRHNVNVEINDCRIEDVAEKIGSLFGDKGQRIGKSIDDLTKNVTIVIDTENNRRLEDEIEW